MRESNLKRRNYNFDNNGETIALSSDVKHPRQYWRNMRSQSHSDLAAQDLANLRLQRIYHLNTKKLAALTMRLHFLPSPYVAAQFQKTLLIFLEQCTCLFAKSLLESLSIPTERLSPKTRRVWINSSTRGLLDKSVGSLNRRVGRSPKRPTNALFEKVQALLI